MLFSKFNVNKGEWLDLVFANRNKSYGAYELRRYSDQYLVKALLVSCGVFVLLVIGPAIYYTYKSQDVAIQTTGTMKYYDDDAVFMLEDMAVPKRELVKTEHLSDVSTSSQVTTVNVNQVKLSQQINVVKDEFGVDMPTIADIENAIVGNTTIEGTNPTDANLLAGTINGTDIKSGGAEVNTLFDMASVESMPEFPGGMSAWSKFLNKNLMYPSVARETGIQGRVTVTFVVEKDGSLSNVKVLRGIGGGCDEEAIRVIKKSPFWKPGVQNGNPVRVSYVIPIVFALQ